MSRLVRQVSLIAAAATCALATTGCAGASSAEASSASVTVVASTDVWGDIAATVGGRRVNVTSLVTSPDQDPHTYNASARDELAVSKADVVVENGGGYDDFMRQLVAAAKADPTVIDAVDVSRLAAHRDEPNEHVWYDLEAAEKVARSMAAAFGKVDPAHAADYASNARSFDSTVDRLIRHEAVLKRHVGGVAVAVTEPVPVYMLDAIGVADVTPAAFSRAVEEGGDVSVATLDATLGLLTGHRVAALVVNEQTADPFTERVRAAATSAGVPVVGVTETLPTDVHYADWMAHNLDHLDTALSRR
ncbi:MAG: zinc/manganese transport system substrate-binding protein [Frankiaceae bacterium]|nr:zinc/manganese transport system substrate-binding protein [Frankiaceae bacterium]